MSSRLFIIQPSHHRSKGDRTLVKTRRRPLIPLSLPYLAALTPADWDVKLVDEMAEDVPFDAPVDLVAITTLTSNSYRAYEVAQEFRQRGVRVVMGGPHTFSHAEETAGHCDAVAIGEGENIWPQILKDAAAGRLRSSYRAEPLANLENLPLPRYDLLNMRHYGILKTFAVQTSRGCPFRCDFCSERLYLGASYRFRPVAEVVREIQHTKSRSIFFADSNFAGHRQHAMELMEALIPLKLRWSTLWSLNYCGDKEFMDLAQRSGLLHVNIGMESIDSETIASMRKRQNAVHKYKDILADLRRRGISYSLNFIFGWDTENRDVFPSTLEFLHRHKVPVAYFNVLTPEKGTPFYDQMLKENRIVNAEEIGRYPGIDCNFRPAYCTPEEMIESVHKLHLDFYNLPSMMSRLPAPITKSSLASWFMNLSMRKANREMSARLEFDSY